jgi:hypothetical protein
MPVASSSAQLALLRRADRSTRVNQRGGELDRELAVLAAHLHKPEARQGALRDAGCEPVRRAFARRLSHVRPSGFPWSWFQMPAEAL